jgi:peroxiredoxin family protein
MVETSTDQKQEAKFVPQSEDRKTLLIVCSKGTLDMAFPPLMMATSAAALDWEVHLYFTFWGMDIVTNAKSLKISPLGNPSMGIPNILSIIPGMTSVATYMMKKKMKETGMPTKEDLIPECDDIIGAATFIDMAGEADVTLFI